jgi:predicted MFS family arabinose efflux permease
VLQLTDSIPQIHEREGDAGHSVAVLALQVRVSPPLQVLHTAKLRRSLFMWYMWRIEDVDVSVLSG